MNEKNKMNCLFDLNSYGDERGVLVPLEAMRQIPFEIKRVYYLTNLKTDYPRGYHAHRETQQFAICLSGSCRFLMDNGKEKADYLLSSSTVGIVINPLVWHEMHDFSKDCVLLVLASHYYDEKDYIREYEEFKKVVL